MAPRLAATNRAVRAPDLPATSLAAFASELAWDAVLTCWQDD